MAARLTIDPCDPKLKREFKATAAALGLTMSQAGQLAVHRFVESFRDNPDQEEGWPPAPAPEAAEVAG